MVKDSKRKLKILQKEPMTEAYRERIHNYFIKRTRLMRGSTQVLDLVLRNLKRAAIKYKRKKRKIINVTHGKVENNLRKLVVIPHQVSKIPLLFKATTLWRRNLYQTRKLFQLKKLTYKSITSNYDRLKKRFVRSLGKRVPKSRPDLLIRARRIYKRWIFFHNRSLFAKIFQKPIKNWFPLKNTSICSEKKQKNKFNDAVEKMIKGISYKKVFPIWYKLKQYDYLGSYTDFEDYDLCISSIERPKRFIKEYLSAFLYNGRPAGSKFGVYFGFHYYVNHYIKHKFRRFTKRFDFVIREDLDDYNEGLEDNFDLITSLNNFTMEVKTFRRDERWYQKNYLNQSKCYLKN